jgi:hypothetical protein
MRFPKGRTCAILIACGMGLMALRDAPPWACYLTALVVICFWLTNDRVAEVDKTIEILWSNIKGPHGDL